MPHKTFCLYHATRRLLCRFTLIELLVVVAIVSILMALLLPGVKRAEDVAKSIHCKGNLRQLALAMSAYAGDNAEWAPEGSLPGYYMYGPNNQSNNDKTLAPYLGVKPASATGSAPFARVAKCMSGRRDGTLAERDSSGRPNFSYAFNSYFCQKLSSSTDGDARYGKLPLVKQPSRRFLCGDSNWSANTHWKSEHFPGRHQGATDNLIFVDAHAENWGLDRKASVGTGSLSGGADGFWHDAISW